MTLKSLLSSFLEIKMFTEHDDDDEEVKVKSVDKPTELLSIKPVTSRNIVDMVKNLEELIRMNAVNMGNIPKEMYDLLTEETKSKLTAAMKIKDRTKAKSSFWVEEVENEPNGRFKIFGGGFGRNSGNILLVWSGNDGEKAEDIAKSINSLLGL